MQNEVKNFKLDRISPSMVSSYLMCPLSFYYGYVAKIRLPHGVIHLEFGSAVHKAIEEMYKGSKNPIAAFEARFKKEKLADNEKHMYKEYVELGKEMLANYFEEHPMLDKLYGLAAGKSEKYIRRYLTHPITGRQSSIPLSGVLDRLTDNGKIIEYKTSKTKWNVEETRFKVQNLLYNLWYYSEYNRIAEETLYFILLKKHKTHKRDQVLQTISSHVTHDDLAAAFEEVELIIEKINSGIFDRPRGPGVYHPDYCDCYKYEKALATND